MSHPLSAPDDPIVFELTRARQEASGWRAQAVDQARRAEVAEAALQAERDRVDTGSGVVDVHELANRIYAASQPDAERMIATALAAAGRARAEEVARLTAELDECRRIAEAGFDSLHAKLDALGVPRPPDPEAGR